jgi:hypothetical protein
MLAPKVAMVSAKNESGTMQHQGGAVTPSPIIESDGL